MNLCLSTFGEKCSTGGAAVARFLRFSRQLDLGFYKWEMREILYVGYLLQKITDIKFWSKLPDRWRCYHPFCLFSVQIEQKFGFVKNFESSAYIELLH